MNPCCCPGDPDTAKATRTLVPVPMPASPGQQLQGSLSCQGNFQPLPFTATTLAGSILVTSAYKCPVGHPR